MRTLSIVPNAVRVKCLGVLSRWSKQRPGRPEALTSKTSWTCPSPRRATRAFDFEEVPPVLPGVKRPPGSRGSSTGMGSSRCDIPAAGIYRKSRRPLIGDPGQFDWLLGHRSRLGSGPTEKGERGGERRRERDEH